MGTITSHVSPRRPRVTGRHFERTVLGRLSLTFIHMELGISASRDSEGRRSLAGLNHWLISLVPYPDLP